jgi:hypothetical protein
VPHAGRGRRGEHVAGAADVDRGHLPLVVERVADEGEVDERARAARREVAGEGRVADVHLVELEPLVAHRRRSQVEPDHPVGRIRPEQPACDARPDVPRAPGDRVRRHRRLRRESPVGCRRQPFPAARPVPWTWGKVRFFSALIAGQSGIYPRLMVAGTIAQAIEEFISLNQRFAACGLEGDEHQRWRGLVSALDTAAVRHAARAARSGTTRRHARAPLSLGVRFLTPPLAGTAQTLDLSCGGCALEIDMELRRGAEVELTLGLPAELGSLHVDGWVCWSTPARRPGRWRAGITFVGLTARERDLLASCVLGDVAPRLGAHG